MTRHDGTLFGLAQVFLSMTFYLGGWPEMSWTFCMASYAVFLAHVLSLPMRRPGPSA